MNTHSKVILVLGLGFSLSSQVSANTHGLGAKKTAHRTPPLRAALNTTPGQTATLLPDGRILLLGGEGAEGPLSTAAVQDPRTGVITSLRDQLQQSRAWHTATLLPDGTVLVLGGLGPDGRASGTVESFDPTALSFHTLSPTGLAPRAHHTATLLTDGVLFVAGGVSQNGEPSGTAQLWDFRNGAATDLARGLVTPRRDQAAALLADGTVLLWGGTQANGTTIPDGELFDPTSKAFSIQTSRPSATSGQTPQVEVTLPEDRAENVPLNTLIAIRFSEPLRVQTVNADSVTLGSPEEPVSAKVIPAEGGMLAFVNPATGLLPGTTYRVTVNGPTDAAGAPLAPTSFSFRTTGKAPNAPSAGAGILGQTQGQAGDPQDSAFRKLPPLQAPPGVTAISGQVLLLDGRPLEGVTLRAGSNRTETDRTGRFLLRDVSGSHVAMVIDGRTASEKRISYGVFVDGVDIEAGRTNVLKYTIWMPEIDAANSVTLSVPTAKEVVVTTPRIPGLEFHIPAGTTITDIDGKVANYVSITPIPITQPPFPLPPGVNVPVYFTIQPGGGYLSIKNSDGPKGAWLIYPNSFHLTVGSSFDFWNYDADQKGWFIYGHGKVAPDGKNILPDPGVLIYELSGAMVGSSGLGPGTGPGLLCRWFGLFCGGEPVDLGTGLFVYDKTDLYLSDVIPISLTRTYRPNDGASRAFGVGTSHNYDLFLVGDSSAYSYINLVFPDGARIHCPRTSTGTAFANAVFQCSSMPGPFFGSTTAWNGNGWTLTRRDGMVYNFHDGFAAQRAQQGALLSITDRNGNTLAVNRDANFNVTEITSPNGRWVQFTYDSNFRITQAQDNLGRTVQYSYDSGGRLKQVIDANNGTWTYNYDSNNNMTSLVDARNITILQNQYDAQNRVIKQTLADGVSAYQFSYNPISCTTNCSGIWETDVTDPNGNVEKVLFNPPPIFSNGFATAAGGSAVTFAAGTSVAQTYTYQYQPGASFITSVTDALNRTTSYTYDALGNVTSITRLAGTPNAATTSISYEAKFSRRTSITDPLGHTTSLTYDSKGNLLAVTDPLGNSSARSYNTAGQLISIINPLGGTTSFTYDGGDLTSVMDPLGRSVAFFKDVVGRTVSRNAAGNFTKYRYSTLDQTTQIIDPNGGVTSYGYDAVGNRTSVADARNTSSPTTYSYDNMDRLVKRTDPLGNQELYQYDGNNNLTQFIDRRGKVATFSYDALNRRTFSGFGKSGSNYESTIGYTFNAGNRLIQAVDSISGTTTRFYDSLNHLTSESTPQATVSYTYDNACRRTSMTVSGQSPVYYSYDNVNHLTRMTQNSTTVSFAYDTTNRRSTLSLPNGVTTSYTYDDASDLTALTYLNGATVLGNVSYGYDLIGRRISLTGTYARINLPSLVSTANYNAANQLSSWGTTNLFYDANGNMTSDGTHSYTWDARNHLVSIDGGNTASFAYDSFGRRVSKNILGTTTAFMYDGANVIQEVIGGSNTANSLVGKMDEIFQRTDSSGARTFLTDAAGSTLALLDSGGELQTQYTFEPFGNPTVSGSSSTNSFAFTGRELDATGLYFYRARYYSSALQRFVSEDPIGLAGGVNTFAYVGNNPTNARDPLGLCPGCGGGGVGGPGSVGGGGGGGIPGGPGGPSSGGVGGPGSVGGGGGGGIPGGPSGPSTGGVGGPGSVGGGGGGGVGDSGKPPEGPNDNCWKDVTNCAKGVGLSYLSCIGVTKTGALSIVGGCALLCGLSGPGFGLCMGDCLEAVGLFVLGMDAACDALLEVGALTCGGLAIACLAE